MKILDVAEFYADAGGGVKTYIDQKLAIMPELGHEVVILAPGPRDQESRRPGGRIIFIKSRRLPLDRRYHVFVSGEAIRSVLREERPDVLECSSPWTGGSTCGQWSESPVKSLVLHQDPVAVYPETMFPQRLEKDRIHRMFRWHWERTRRLTENFDVTVVGSDWFAKRLKRFGATNTRVVPFGVRRERFIDADPDPKLRTEMLARCGLPPDAALLMAVSRHHPEKRIGTLIDAVGQVNQRRPVGLYLCGDGPIRRWVENRASRVPQVYVAGFVRDRDWLATAMASADAFLHGSAAETFGLAVAEALSTGLPVITPDEGAAADLIHPRFSETYEAGSPTDCADSIDRILDRLDELPPDLIRHFAIGRIHSAASHFRALSMCYEGLLKQKAVGGVEGEGLSLRPTSVA